MIRYTSEIARKAIHIASLAIPIGLYFTPIEVARPIILTLTLVMLAGDVVRLHVPWFRTVFYFLFGRLLRDHERFNLLGSTYLFMAALLCVYMFPKPIAVVALGFVVVGDATAALVGRRWGRIKFLDKSLEGSLGCLAACLAIGFVYPGPGMTPLMVVVGALVATLFELLPIPLDDNLRMSLSAGFAMLLVS